MLLVLGAPFNLALNFGSQKSISQMLVWCFSISVTFNVNSFNTLRTPFISLPFFLLFGLFLIYEFMVEKGWVHCRHWFRQIRFRCDHLKSLIRRVHVRPKLDLFLNRFVVFLFDIFIEKIKLYDIITMSWCNSFVMNLRRVDKLI